jgi:predicted MFS family arabinose efflux permease
MANATCDLAGQQAAVADARPAKLGAYTWYVIGLLTAINILNFMDRISMSVLVPYIKKDLGLSDGQIGLLVGFAFFLVYAVCGIPIARIADGGARKAVILFSLTVWGTMTSLSGAAQNFWHLLVARLGLGVGEAGCVPTIASLISEYVPQQRRSGVFAIMGVGGSVGAALGIGLAGWLGQELGWRWAFVILGIPPVILAILVKFTLRSPPRETVSRDKGEKGTSFRDATGILVRARTYRRVAIFLVLNAFVTAGGQQWYASFYNRVHDMPLDVVGLWLGLATGVGSTIGLLIGGLASDRMARRDMRLPFILGASGLAISLPTSLAILFAPSPVVSIAMIALTGALINAPIGPVTAALYGTVPAQVRATGGAVAVFMIAILGYGLGPFCVGLLSDQLTPAFGEESLRYALLLPLVIYPFYIGILWAARKDVVADSKVTETVAA